jgi:NAD(P)-dependent dehydrogenase (short-subunit alcohol dehydrogenase family)
VKRRFAEKAVLITGAGAGIGRALALAYAREGAAVALADKNAEGLAQTGAMLQAEGYEPLCKTADLGKPEEVAELFQALEDGPGKLDILINNAGFGIWKSLFELTLAEWDDVVNTNLRGTFLCSREAARLMKRAGSGGNLSSTRAMMSEPNSEAYAASKGGILSLTHALAVSLGAERITVNAICPGWIETGNYEGLKETDHNQHPAGRVGRPEDIVKACFFLTDPGNDFVTGTHITVDGGMTRKMIYEE